MKMAAIRIIPAVLLLGTAGSSPVLADTSPVPCWPNCPGQ